MEPNTLRELLDSERYQLGIRQNRLESLAFSILGAAKSVCREFTPEEQAEYDKAVEELQAVNAKLEEMDGGEPLELYDWLSKQPTKEANGAT